MTTTHPMTEVIRALEAAGLKPKPQGREHVALCPCHDDHEPSLRIRESDDGRVLMHCDPCGANGAQVCEVLKLPAAALFPSDGHGHNGVAQNGVHHNGKATRPRPAAVVEPKPAVVSTREMGEVTFDYVDEAGELLYQVLRTQREETLSDGTYRRGKKIVQRRPDGDGWAYQVGDVRRVLYRLPELLERAGDEVFIVEGEPKVEVLRSWGLAATCHAGGTGGTDKALDLYAETLRGRRVVLMPDNDAAGRESMSKIARRLRNVAASVRLLELPGLPAKGDVVDWAADGHTRDELLELAAAAPVWVDDDDEPERLRFKPFPVEALPLPLQHLATEGARAMSTDPAAFAVLGLPVLAGAIGNRWVLRIKPGHTVPAVLWGTLMGTSGIATKSPVHHAAVKPLIDLDVQAATSNKQDRDDHTLAVERHKALMTAWRAKATKSSGATLDPPTEPARPRERHHTVSDTTVEGLVKVLEDNPAGVLLAMDELRGLVAGFDRYVSKGGADECAFLGMHNAGTVKTTRAGTGSRVVPRAAVSICGTIQPGVMRTSLGKAAFLESGFTPRFLMAWPPERVRVENDDCIADATAERWKNVVQDLAAEPTLDKLGQVVPHVAEFSDEARTIRRAWQNNHNRRTFDAPPGLASALSKLGNMADRFALVHHAVEVIEGRSRTPLIVSAASMRAGLALADWFVHEGERIYNKLGFIEHQDEPADDTDELLEWIRGRGGAVTVRDLQSSRRRKYPKSKDARKRLDQLDKAGYGTLTKTKPGPAGGPPSEVFALNPEPGDTGIDETL